MQQGRVQVVDGGQMASWGTKINSRLKTQGFDSYYGAPENMGHSKLFYDEKRKVIYKETPLKKLAGLYTAKVVEAR